MTSGTSAKNLIPLANKYDRVILLVDMDCFYCQVEEKLDPSLKNQPLAVVQYNAWKGGGIIAVNYAARAKGVTRHMRGDEAKEQCPDIKLVKVPNVREKADLTKYREAGKEVAGVLQRFTPLLERASVDEAYLDITEAVNKRLQEMNDGTFILQPQELLNTYAVGYETIGEFVTTITTSFITNPLADDNRFYLNYNENDVPSVRQSNIRLLIGASIASEIRNAVKAETSYECSAGIAHNKILAKLACGINKPNKQTVLPLAQIPELFETLPIGKIKGLGAKFGEEVCERLNIRYLGQMLKFTEAELQRKFDEKNGSWLYNICRGIDLEAVTPRFYSKSIGCCKKFPGRNNICGLKTLQHWLNELANEIRERLEKDICENNRRAKQMVVSFIQEIDGEEVSSSRSAPLQSYDTEMLATTSLEIIRSNTKQFFRSGSESVLNNPIKFLGISVGKFETISNSQSNIQEMFAQQAAKKQKLQNDLKTEIQTTSLSFKKIENGIQSGHKAKSDPESNSLKQISKEKSNKDIDTFLIKVTDPNKSETNLDFKKNNEPESNSSKEVSTAQNSKQIKSFFLNALKKSHYKENIKSSTNDNYIEDIVEVKPISSKLELNSINQNELTTSRRNNFYDDTNNIITSNESFFTKAEGTLRSETANNSTFDTKKSNQKLKINDDSCNELNDLINEINTQQNEENVDNLELQNKDENNCSSNSLIKTNNINSLLQMPDNNSVLKKRKHETISESEELNQTDYRSEYAEFATPELATEFLKFINCSKCGAKVLDDVISMQTHQDLHFAQELSTQQRQEYRDEFRSKINSSKSPHNSNKKTKKFHLNTRNTFEKSCSDITKFLKPAPSTLPSLFSSDRNQNTENATPQNHTCDICKLSIKVEEILEHKDFHIAKDLQRKLNQLEVHTVDVLKKKVSDSSQKSLNSSISLRHNKSAAKPITQFFTHSNI